MLSEEARVDRAGLRKFCLTCQESDKGAHGFVVIAGALYCVNDARKLSCPAVVYYDRLIRLIRCVLVSPSDAIPHFGMELGQAFVV